ncbi:MAG TPA: tetratricopeptide repeat protein [Flavobacteriales bacterium]|nr:tetratricopeptide repeat protein [Flavobacteriales bacterium]
MKHLLLPFVLLFAVPFSASAQKHVYDDLLVLYVDEEYEKCIAKADRYTEKDDTRRDPLPYLYKSMCYHEMSKLEKYTSQHDYRYADRDALKNAALYRKKDKKNEFFSNFEDYWMELNTHAMGNGLALYEMGEFSKARRVFDRMVVYMPENAGAWRMRALCQERMNLKRDAIESLKQFDEAYAAIGDPADLPTDQRRLLRQALILEAEYLLATGRTTEAKAAMALGEDTFMGNAEFKALFDELN